MGLVVFLAGGLAAPERVLPLFWSGVVPLLPVLFLLNPGLWRNVCPLATLGMGPDDGAPGAAERTLSRACLLLLVLLPLRPLGLEGSALASTGLLAAAGAGAVLGRGRARKAGFCNTWCPVLPVERLYGQRPLLSLENPRCPTCTLCTPRGCLDLSPRAASAQLLGPGRRSSAWLTSSLGAFAAAFPGVVLAFFLLPPDPGVARAYGQVALGGGVSWAVLGGAVALGGVGWRLAFPTLGALAAGPYLWFALPGVAVAWGVPWAADGLRYAGVALVAVWWIQALRQTDEAPATPGRP